MSLITLLRPEQRATTARVRSSACRGYIVELDPDNSKAPKLLKNLWGKVIHFRSLSQVRDVLLERGIHESTLYQRHACEELGALGTSSREEAGVPLFRDDALRGL